MAYALAQETIRRSWLKLTGKLEGDARLCQTCGSRPSFQLGDLPNYQLGDQIRLTCEQEHSPVEKVVHVLVADELTQRYAARYDTAKDMVQEWNDKQEEIRNQQMFPGVKR